MTATERYLRYMRSRAWEERRRDYFSRHRKACAFCGTTHRIDLHHHTYVRMGDELDDDLVPLCREHHQMVHSMHRTGKYKSLTEATQAAAQAVGCDITIRRRKPRTPGPNRKQRDKERRRRKQQRARQARKAKAERREVRREFEAEFQQAEQRIAALME